MSTTKAAGHGGVDNALPTLGCVEPTRGESPTLRGYDNAKRRVLSVFGRRAFELVILRDPAI